MSVWFCSIQWGYFCRKKRIRVDEYAMRWVRERSFIYIYIEDIKMIHGEVGCNLECKIYEVYKISSGYL